MIEGSITGITAGITARIVVREINGTHVSYRRDHK